MENTLIKNIHKHKNNSNFKDFILGVIIALILGALDYLTGSDLSFIVFYMIPIYLVAWNCNLVYGFIMTLVCLIIWLNVNILWPMEINLSRTIMIFWSIFEKILFFGIALYVIYSLKMSIQKEKQLARKDYLTPLGNRRAFIEELKDRTKPFTNDFSVVYFDIDGFYDFFQQDGQLAADDMIKSIASMIYKKYNLSFRFEEDKFAIIFNEISGETALTKMRNLKEEIQKELYKKKKWSLGISVGIVLCTKPDITVSVIMKEMFHQLLKVKQSGGDQIKLIVL